MVTTAASSMIPLGFYVVGSLRLCKLLFSHQFGFRAMQLGSRKHNKISSPQAVLLAHSGTGKNTFPIPSRLAVKWNCVHWQPLARQPANKQRSFRKHEGYNFQQQIAGRKSDTTGLASCLETNRPNVMPAVQGTVLPRSHLIPE